MMKIIQQKSVFRSLRSMVFMAAIFVIVTFIFAWNMQAVAASSQRIFSSPQDAVKALNEAVNAKDNTALDQIFGTSGKDLRSGDEVQDAIEFAEFAKYLAEKSDIMKENDSKVILHIGNENWPFPVPIVKFNDKWFFDIEAGKEEILNRRIGENELTAILVCRAYVKAQREYVLKDWDGDGIFAYAQKLRSDHGKRNGLFWRSAPGKEMSPLGELVARAWHEGYKKNRKAFKEDEPSPFHGYYFKILTAQGKNVPGGGYNFIANGNMVGGFAMVAFPSNWGKSGVMTFAVNQQGKVYEKNLGQDTEEIAQKMKLYNPDKTWTPAKE
jgi:Protein of unknown function (DUF2950).